MTAPGNDAITGHQYFGRSIDPPPAKRRHEFLLQTAPEVTLISAQPAPSDPTSGFHGHGLSCVRGERRVFTGLDFALAPGELLLLSGPNGSGKSSLLRLMTGLLRPAVGELRWNGAPIKDDLDAHCRRLHYVGHADALKPMLTARQNLSFWARLTQGRPEAAIAGMLDAALEYFALTHLADLPCRLLSAGQKRRLALARLLAAPAPLWLLDEPTLGLDAASFQRLTGALSDHCQRGGMVVCATHIDLGLALARQLPLDDFAAAQGGFADPFAEDPPETGS